MTLLLLGILVLLLLLWRIQLDNCRRRWVKAYAMHMYKRSLADWDYCVQNGWVSLLDDLNGDTSEDPVEAAEDDMSCWGSD